MATISVTVNDAIVARLTTAICARYNYDPAKDGTQAAFVKARVVAFLKENLVAYEAQVAADPARDAAAAKAAADFG